MKNTPKKLRNLTRIVVGGQKGWQVKINRRGERHEPYFSDSVYGGKQQSLAAAMKARDALDQKCPPYSRIERAQRVTRRTKSGVPGVRLLSVHRKLGKRARTYLFAIASWCPRPGVIKRRAFSVAKFGKRQAWQLAVAARQQGLKAMKP
jgi:hypothetical protein